MEQAEGYHSWWFTEAGVPGRLRASLMRPEVQRERTVPRLV